MDNLIFRKLIDDVRERTDIAALIGADVDLKPAGSVLKGSSPFRTDNNPSFVVWPDSKYWRDYSGGGSEGGDCIDYIMLRDSLTFIEAVRKLATSAEVPFPGIDDTEFEAELDRISIRRRIENLLTKAARYYHSVLPSKIRAEWLYGRYGFTDETIDMLELGWADGHLHEYLITQLKTSVDEALSTGLFIRLGGGKVKDFFCDRLVFPYWHRGRVVYFIARATEHTGDESWEKAKYKKLLTHSDRHSYVSPLVANDTFYNEDAVYTAGDLLITEGVTDCISAMQAGFTCISPVTVRFRHRDQEKLITLTKRAKRVIICNDSEQSGAGEAGAEETAQALYKAGCDARIAVIPRPEGKDKIDLNELVVSGGSEALDKVVQRAKRLPDYLVERVPPETPKADLSERLRPIIELVQSSDPLIREAFADLLRDRFKLKSATVKSLLAERPQKDEVRKEECESTTIKTKEPIYKGEVFEDTDHYYILGRHNEPIIISSFQIEPTRRILVEGGEIIDASVTSDRGSVFHNARFPREAWNSKRNFLQTLKRLDLQWTGSDENVQGVLRLIANRTVPSKNGTLNLGYLETKRGPVWVTPQAVIAPAGSDTPTGEIIFVPTGDPLSSRIKIITKVDPAVETATAALVLQNILNLNSPEVILPIIGWFFAAPLKPRIQKLLNHFPILFLWGLAGSGKSTLIKEVFWPLMGLTSTEPFSATETEFALLKLLSATNSIPVFIDEYKPKDMQLRRRNTLHRYMRRLYTGEVEGRGRSDQTVTSYHLSAPLCMAGESRPTESAVVERIVTSNPNKTELERQPVYIEALRKIKTVNVGLLTNGIIRHLLSRDTEADLGIAQRVIDTLLKDTEVPLRFRDNLIAVVTGLLCFEGYAESMKTYVPELDIETFVNAEKNDLLDSGGTAVKTGLDYFLEILSSLAISGAIQHGRQYYYTDDYLALHIPSCHAAYAEHCRRTNYEGEIVDKKSLTRELQENRSRGGYIVEINKTTSFGSRSEKRRAAYVNVNAAKAILDVDDFPRPELEYERGLYAGWQND